MSSRKCGLPEQCHNLMFATHFEIREHLFSVPFPSPLARPRASVAFPLALARSPSHSVCPIACARERISMGTAATISSSSRVFALLLPPSLPVSSSLWLPLFRAPFCGCFPCRISPSRRRFRFSSQKILAAPAWWVGPIVEILHRLDRVQQIQPVMSPTIFLDVTLH